MIWFIIWVSLTILLIWFSYLFIFLRVCIPGICTCLFALLFIINYLLSSDRVLCFEFHCCSFVFCTRIIISGFDIILYNLRTHLSNMVSYSGIFTWLSEKGGFYVFLYCCLFSVHIFCIPFWKYFVGLYQILLEREAVLTYSFITLYSMCHIVVKAYFYFTLFVCLYWYSK